MRRIMWKFRESCDNVPVHANDERQREYAISLEKAMSSPSPSELCWVIGFSPKGRWIAPVLRDAVAAELDTARDIARRHLGDERAVAEIMELAIQRTAEYLADLSPIDLGETRSVLTRFYRNEVRRRCRAEKRFRFVGETAKIASIAIHTDQAFSGVEAQLDLASILENTTPAVRKAMLLRYGFRTKWREVGEFMSKSDEAARKICERELKHLRRYLRIEERPPHSS